MAMPLPSRAVGLVLACVALVASAAAREYGILFDRNDSFVQTKYSVLCDESVVRLSLYFNTSSGVILFAENEMAKSSIVVYFRRPGIYVNATLGNKLFHLAFMMDFFNNDWIGWHEIEIRLGLKRLGLVFDGVLREGAFENRFLFPGSTVENNLVLFGIFFKNNEISVPGFHGFMRNIQFKSCSCDEWRPVDIVLTKGISFAHLGECSQVSACPKRCSCVLLDSGQHRCDCAGLHCPKPDDQVFYGFDVKEQGSGARHQLSVVSRSGDIQYSLGIFDEAFKISKSRFIDLTASEGRTCFRNIFLCESEFFYQFWLRVSVPVATHSVTHVLKHSSSIKSIYGLDLTRLQNEFQVTLSLDYNRRFQLNFSIPLLVWNRISVSFNQTHLKLYVNADLIRTTDVSVTFPEEKSKVVNTRFLFVGDLQGNPMVEIDHFYFSTNEKVLANPSVQNWRIKRRTEDQTNLTASCNLDLTGGLVNLTDCYRKHFKKSNFTLGFYASLIVHRGAWTQSSPLLQTSMFGLSLTGRNLIEIKVEGSVTREIRLKPTLNSLTFVEISITADNRMVVYQDIDTFLDTMYVDMGLLIRGSERFQIAANINERVVEEMSILNMAKEVGIRARRVQTSQVIQYSVDFDNANADQYLKAKIEKGYVGKGMKLQPKKGLAVLDSLNGSCVTNVHLCLNGLTISFWFKLLGSVSASKNKMVQLLFSGERGIVLALADEDIFILTVMGGSTIRYSRKDANLPKDTWHLLELSVSGQSSLFIDGLEWQSQVTTAPKLLDCGTRFYVGDPGFSGDLVIFLDEINIFEAERNFLYATQFLSTEISRYKLYSFTNYGSTGDLKLEGGSELVPTRYGQGVLFKGLESGVAISRITDEINCLSRIDDCRRGFTIRLLFRIDTLDVPRQIFLSNPQFTIGSNLGTLFVKVSSLNSSWSFTSTIMERLFSWQTLEISWRMNTGLKVFINGELVGQVVHGMKERLEGSASNSLLYFGRNQFGNSSDFSNVLIDDLELFEADKNNQACQRPFASKGSCRFQNTFDEHDEMSVNYHLGVVGNAGWFTSNITSLRRFTVPPCFEDLTVRCKDCLSLRLWLRLNGLNTAILRANHLTISISQDAFHIDVQNDSPERRARLSCFYFTTNLINSWTFLEFSWDADEGLLVFVNRDLLLCKQLPNESLPHQTFVGIEISDAFEGSIDEIELYKSRLSTLYLEETVDEMGTDIILQSVKDRQQQPRVINTFALLTPQGSGNVTQKRIQSYQFNGLNYLEYRVVGRRDLQVPGMKEEIELSFKCPDTNVHSVLWVTEAKASKNILILKSRKLFFITMYTGTSNESRQVTEEKEIAADIEPDTVYNVLISQKSLEILIKVTSPSNSSLLSLVGKENLFPISSTVFVGGYKDGNKSKIAGTNSLFTGVMYKARIKTTFHGNSVNIGEETLVGRSSSRLVNHGNVRAVTELRETVLSPSAVLLGTIIPGKMSVTISSPFVSINLPKWDFEILTSLEIEFSTLESRGLLLFIGNSSDFMAVELFDSQLYLIYTLLGTAKRFLLNQQDSVVNDNGVHSLYIGRDLSGHIKAIYDRKTVMNNVQILKEYQNSSTIIGSLGLYELWPQDILSRVGFVGCIHFIGINGLGYVDVSRWRPFSNSTWDSFNTFPRLEPDFLIGQCHVADNSSCYPSRCRGGLCQSVQYSRPGSLSNNNYKCNCFSSNKALDNGFVGSTPKENFAIWIRNYLLESRSRWCSEEAPRILIIEKAVFTVQFKIQFPFTSILDLRFLVSMQSTDGCLVSISTDSTPIELVIVDGVLSLKFSENLEFSVPDILLTDFLWHGVEISLRSGQLRMRIDNVDKVTDFVHFPVSKISVISVGECSKAGPFHFKMKNLEYNGLSLFQDMKDSDSTRLFYSSNFVYPRSSRPKVNHSDEFGRNSVTFLNNFESSAANRLLVLSWLTEIDIVLIVQFPGSFVHLINGRSILSLLVKNKTDLIFFYKDPSKPLKTSLVSFKNENFHIRIVIDLMISEITYETLTEETSKQTLVDHIYQWNVDDKVQVLFGRHGEADNIILQETRDLPNSEELQESLNRSFVGCLRAFTVSNSTGTLYINRGWTNLMVWSPPFSVLTNRCIGVKKCSPDFCINGVCRSGNVSDVYCDCRGTEYQGERCHVPKPLCPKPICKNKKDCVSTLSSLDRKNLECHCVDEDDDCAGPSCRFDPCVNHGKCYVLEGTVLCNCSGTGFVGERCQHWACSLLHCGEHGSCLIHNISKTASCECQDGYFGQNCEILGASQCTPVCTNGGLCSIYSPALRLCSRRHCGSPHPFKCSCDHTTFSGGSCEQLDLGFDPTDDGILILDKLQSQEKDYLRFLFEPFEKETNMSIGCLSHSHQEHLVIRLESKSVWMEYHSPWNTTGHKMNMGQVARINNLMMLIDRTEVNFLFNAKEGHFRIPGSSPGSLQRQKRSAGNPDNKELFPRIIIGSDQNIKEAFIGLIAGVKWNNQDVLNKRNTVMKGETLLTVNKLTVKPFPKPSSYLIIPSTDKHTLVTLLVIMAGILCFIIAFYIIRKVRSADVSNNLYVPVDTDSGKLIQNNVEEPDKLDCRISIQSDKVLATLVSLEACVPTDYTDSMYKPSKLVLIRDVNCLQNLAVIDILIVPDRSHIALLVKEDIMFPIFQNLFPLDEKDEEYSCQDISISADHHYAFAHMASLNRTNKTSDDLVELQVWKIRDTWHLICRPPNVCFTSSIPIPGSPSCMLLVNRQSQTLSIWNLEVSNVIWQLGLDDSHSLPLRTICVSLNTEHIFIDYRSKFQILSLSSDDPSAQMSDQDYPFPTDCLQICYIQKNIFLIRTESQQIYLFNAEDYSFGRKSEFDGIVLVQTLEYQNVIHIGLATNTGEVYVTQDILDTEYVLLGPGNRTDIVCAQFSLDASLFCAGYENNVIHVWKIATDIPLCHFHAIHDSIPLRKLQFTSDRQTIIATLRKGIEGDSEEKILSLINRH